MSLARVQRSAVDLKRPVAVLRIQQLVFGTRPHQVAQPARHVPGLSQKGLRPPIAAQHAPVRGAHREPLLHLLQHLIAEANFVSQRSS